MQDKEFSSINVIPLVDIMLVLLVIVLTTATFIVQGSLEVNLPSAKNVKQESLKGLSISIDEYGNIYFEKSPTSLLELEQRLLSVDKETPLFIYADKEAKVEKIVELLDLLKKLGFKKVSLRTLIS